MPSMANITIKKSDGTTDVVYTGLTASAGDNAPARWRSDSVGGAVGNRPNFAMLTRNNGAQNGRAATSRFRFPVVRSVNGADVVVGTIPFELHGTVGDQFTDAEIAEAVDQAMNMLGSSLHRASLKAGFSPTAGG